MIAPVRAFQLLAHAEGHRFMRDKVHATIVVLRRAGRLETANRVSEWQHCLERGYAPTLLQGFPDEPSKESST